MELTTQQSEVFKQIKDFMQSDASVFILRGYAGTGKTTMVKIIADEIKKSRQIFLMAPTGRAARVLQQKTGHEAATIHKTIYEKARIVTNRSKDDDDDKFEMVFPIRINIQGNIVAIVDEASMLNTKDSEHELYKFGTNNLMNDLLTFVRLNFGGKIIFVGDPAQLPPVGDKHSYALQAKFFEDRNYKVMEAELTEVLRQKGESAILNNAMMIRDLLNKEKRNRLVFEEKKDDVEYIPSNEFLDKYMDNRKKDGGNSSALICFSNKSASGYNRDIRRALYGGDVPLREGDTLQIVQNNYMLNRMNGEFVTVLSVGRRITRTAKVKTQTGRGKETVSITLTFIDVEIPDDYGNPIPCFLIEDLLENDNASLSIEETKALFADFCIRHPQLKRNTEEFADELMKDSFFNAVRAKYGYAVTGHKCQGGEWDKVFVNYTDRTGLDDDSLRWAYTATTRAQQTLYITNLPKTTPFSKFRIETIQKCKQMNAECRILNDVADTPFHKDNTDNAVKAKYHCIAKNMEHSQYSIHSVASNSYLDTYSIQTPDGIEKYDLHYKAGGIFLQAKPKAQSIHTTEICRMLNDEQNMPYSFSYIPSEEIFENMYGMIRSACDTFGVQITNVVENKTNYNVIYYLRTSSTFSYIKIYFDSSRFVKYAQPMSLIGEEDSELCNVVEEIKKRFV